MNRKLKKKERDKIKTINKFKKNISKLEKENERLNKIIDRNDEFISMFKSLLAFITRKY